MNAYDLAITRIEKVHGQVFNIGGGIKNSISIWREFQPLLEKIQQKKISWKQLDWRPGDQKIYISDTGKFEAVTGWKAEVDVLKGIQMLTQWVEENPALFQDFI